MKKYLKILKECPLFREIESSDLLKMLVCLDARVETFDKKYTIIAEGNPAKYIGIVLTAGYLFELIKTQFVVIIHGMYLLFWFMHLYSDCSTVELG